MHDGEIFVLFLALQLQRFSLGCLVEAEKQLRVVEAHSMDWRPSHLISPGAYQQDCCSRGY